MDPPVSHMSPCTPVPLHCGNHVFARKVSLIFGTVEVALGECPTSGVSKKLVFCPHELEVDSTAIVKWRMFEKIKSGTNPQIGLPKTILTESYKETPPHELVNYLIPTLQKFIRHNYVARWQDSQCKLAMSSLPKGFLLSHIDFAENYTFQVQNEVQSQYYYTVAVTILIHITYKVVHNEDTNTSSVLKESQVMTRSTIGFLYNIVYSSIGSGCKN